MEHFWPYFWTIFLAVLIVWGFIGDGVEKAFYAIVGRDRKKEGHLTTKEAKKLQSALVEARGQVDLAYDILHDVVAADKVFPQLPQDTRDRADKFVAVHSRSAMEPKSLRSPKEE